MTQLFTQYTISEIIVFIIALALAIKSLVQFIDWARKRTKQAIKQFDRPSQIQQKMRKHDQQLKKINKDLDDIKELINLLIESDRDDIKQAITKDHHYFCYKLKSIDDYSLDCMQKRYSHYKEEGGNSFVATLMQEVRVLPRKMEIENR